MAVSTARPRGSRRPPGDQILHPGAVQIGPLDPAGAGVAPVDLACRRIQGQPGGGLGLVAVAGRLGRGP